MKSPKRQGRLKIWAINPFPQPSSWYFYIPEPLMMSAVVWLHFLDFMEENGISFHHLWPTDLGRFLTLLKAIIHLGAAWEDSVFQYSLPSFFHVFAFLLFFSIASQAWNSVSQRGLHPSSISGHRCSPRAANILLFKHFGGSNFFFLSQSLWAVNRASAGNNTLVGKRRFTSSWIRQQQEIKLRCLLRSLHQSDFAQSFQENSSAHTPTMPGRALLCWALSGFLQQPGLNFHGVFSFKETRKTRDTFSFLPKSPLMTRWTNLPGQNCYFSMWWNEERTDSFEKNFPFSLTCQVLQQLLRIQGRRWSRTGLKQLFQMSKEGADR